MVRPRLRDILTLKHWLFPRTGALFTSLTLAITGYVPLILLTGVCVRWLAQASPDLQMELAPPAASTILVVLRSLQMVQDF